MRIGAVAGGLVIVLAACSGGGTSPGPDDVGGAADVPADVSDPGPANQAALYDEAGVPDLELSFTDTAWRAFLDHWTHKVKADEKCDVGFRGVWARDAACRPKGNEGDWDEESRPQFLVTINEYQDQRLLGLRRLDLESNRNHPAPIRDRLAMGMMREAGIAAPRVNHARVFVNGNYYGLYQNVEYVNQEFVRTHFGRDIGNLYEKGTELKTNETVPDTSDLEALNALVAAEPMEGDHAAFFATLATLVDVSQVIRVTAAEVVLPSYDNFSNGSWNYWWYHVPGAKFVLIPWDLDDCLSALAPADADPRTFLGHATSPSRLRQLIDLDPAWHQEFVDRLVEVRDGAFAGLAARTAEVCGQVRDAFVADPTKGVTVEAFDSDCTDVARRVEARRTFLLESLGR